MIAELKRRTYLRHPLAAAGVGLILSSIVLFIVLVLIDVTAPADNPYRGLVTFIGAPAIGVLGLFLFLISIWHQARRARKRGEEVKFDFSIIPYDQEYRRSMTIYAGIIFIMIALVIYSGYRGYEETDSVAFCGETCHEVMEPQNVTYHNSAHARVPCVECHIGPGASFWVRAKLDGVRQVYASMMNTYSRPIETPVANLRPAQQTCEGCHWPKQFYGEKLVTRTYYRTDEENSAWTINLLVKIGGGNPRTGRLEGIHWHMLENTIDYVPSDHKRQIIPWLRMITKDGDTLVYKEPGTPEPDFTNPEVELRRFDCMDCHNRPSHNFQPPAKSMNLALSTRNISSEIPYIRQVGLDLLNAEYVDREEAREKITAGLAEYYNENYPEFVESHPDEMMQASKWLWEIYRNNFFPEMKTDYRARENNLSHFVNDGCFRCHDGMKENQYGVKLSHDCQSCHLIVAQGPSEEPSELESNIAGLEFDHPEDIDEAWKEMLCTDCHTPDSGY
jgi:hypothetical protein